MDPRSAESLVEHLPLLLNYVGRRLRYYEAIGDVQPDALTPEEIVRAVYLEAGEHLHGPPRGERGYRWLRALADRILEREIRRVRAERARVEDVPAIHLGRRLPDVFPDPTALAPDNPAAEAEAQRALARVVGDLPAELREPFFLRVVDGYDREDVAAVEGISPEEADRRVARAALVLRDRVAREYAEREAPRLEELFRLVQRLEPSNATEAYARAQLEAASTPQPPTAA